MFFLLCLFLIPTLVNSQCYSPQPQTWFCDPSYQFTNLTYENVLQSKPVEMIYLTNYRLQIFRIDDYPLTLRLLNASGNQFNQMIITAKHRQKSNLRQLILQSNQLEQFDSNTIVLPNSLEKISLANNQLTILDARLFSHLKNLTEIDLRNNQLKRILPQLLINRNILLDANPLDCQCTTESYRIVCEKSTTIKQTVNQGD